jgi:hypothetical protein
MKAIIKLLGIIALITEIGLFLAACDSGGGGDSGDNNGGGGNGIPVTFLSVSANGSASQTTTQLTLNFSNVIDGLSASNITLSGLSGLSKGTFAGNNPYTLLISGLSETGTLTVAVSKSGYTISDSPKTTTIYYKEGPPTNGVFGDFEYQEYSKWIVISKYKGLASSVTIPNQIAGKPVTSIGDEAFFNCATISSITIPNSITSIGVRAFFFCDRLTNVTIPNSVTSIGTSAFDQCVALTSVIIGNGVTIIGGYSFSQCSSLTSVTIGNSVTSIGGWAFYLCENLASITIPNIRNFAVFT